MCFRFKRYNCRTAPTFDIPEEEDEECDELDGMTSSVDRHEADSPDSGVIQFTAHPHVSDTDLFGADDSV